MRTRVENSHGNWIVSSIYKSFGNGYTVDETAVYKDRDNRSLLDNIYIVGDSEYHHTAVERLLCEWNPDEEVYS